MSTPATARDTQYTCKACGHKWTGRMPWLPVVCPKCKSYKWDQDKPDDKS